MNEIGLVYIGKIIDLQPILGADFIVSATVICGSGGKWKGIVKKTDFQLGDLCTVYLPDSLIPECEEMEFMRSSNWRVRMRRFKGAPSEVLIIPFREIDHLEPFPVGTDITEITGVTKYHKPVSPHLQGIAKGPFPSFIPKTDEPNYQAVPELIDALHGKPFYITEKCDGSSTTAYRYKGNFGLCSRNLELERNEENGYWKVAIKYRLEDKLPEGYAIQWETCGPKIQGNPMGLKDIDGFAFSGYKIDEHRYLEMTEFMSLLDGLKFPMCRIIHIDRYFNKDSQIYPISSLGEGTYLNGKQREGIVVRSQENFDHKPISFKFINLGYDN